MITLTAAKPCLTCHGLFMDSLAELQPDLKVHGGDTTSMPHTAVLMDKGLLPVMEATNCQRHAQSKTVPSDVIQEAMQDGRPVWRAG
jgi:UDP-N-acetylmuramate-alanine ligase